MSKVRLESLGCKLNQAEIEALADRLVSRGHVLTGSAGEADVYVLNTCTVTHIADRKSRQALRSARRANPRARVIATGCYARRVPEEVRRLGVVDVILGDAEGDSLVGAIEGNGHARTTRLTGDSTGGWSRSAGRPWPPASSSCTSGSTGRSRRGSRAARWGWRRAACGRTGTPGWRRPP